MPQRLHERDESARTVLAIPGVTAAGTSTPQKAALPVAAVSGGVDKQAGDLVERSRAALTRGDNASAIQLLTKILQLPPNRHSQEAQELIGLAHERHGEPARAKKEYALYLRLYPEGEGTERVRQRLANIETAPATKTLATARKKEVSVSTAFRMPR